MEVILLEDVRTLGKRGDTVNVNEGYARNFLFKKKLAIEATKQNINDLKLKKAHEAKVEAEKLAEAREFAEKLKEMSVDLSIKTGSNGRSFGSVSSKEVAEAFNKKYGYELDKKKMLVDPPIKAPGVYMVKVKLHKSVTGELKVNVHEA